MKTKLLYIALVLLGFFTSCKKDADPIFEDSDTRLAAELAADQAKLLTAENGWKATIYPSGGKGFFFYLKFTADGKVGMMADINSTTATTIKESTYRLKALQRPTLIFDTYNYIHLIADPDANVSTGATGAGLKSDFEFAFAKSTADSLYFEGTFYGNKMVLSKLSPEESRQVLAGGLKTFMDKTSPYITGKILYIMLDGKQVPVALSSGSKVFSIAGKVSSAFSYNLNGLDLASPVKYDKYTFDKIYWDDTNKYFYLMDGSNKIQIQVSPAPLVLETTQALHTVLGTRWTSMQINVANLPDLSADFLAKYNTANASLGTLGNAGRYIEYITIIFNPNGTVTFQIRYRNPSSPTSVFNADFIYNMNLNATTGVAKFTLAAAPAGNAATVNTYVTALTTYFANNNFKIGYIAAAGPSGANFGGFLSQDNTASFFYGVLVQ
jgi:hypothetical protein